MKESIGAAWIFTICVAFIVLFTAYIALSVNYAKAFKLKSHIVTDIEESDGDYDLTEINTYLTSQGYAASGTCPVIPSDSRDTGWSRPECVGSDDESKCRACIYKRNAINESDDFNTEGVYYKVTTFFKFDLPVINLVMPPIRVSGDTQYIVKK